MALLGVAAVTYLAARVVGTWELYLIALAFAALVAVGWTLVAAGSRSLGVTRRADPEQPVDGEALRLEFMVRTGWRLPGLRLALDGATAGLPGLPDPVDVEHAGLSRERLVMVGPHPARRGVYRLPSFTVAVEDPLGLVRARRAAGEPQRLIVVPRLEELSSCPACSQKGVRPGGGRRPLPSRSAWEFRAIRPHLPGEPLERVDWKSTAKTGNLMLREMEADTENDLTLLLNAPPPQRSRSAAGQHDAEYRDDAFETAVAVAGSMAAFTLHAGHAVSLLLPGDGWQEVRLTPDAVSRRRLLAALAEAEQRRMDRIGAALPTLLGGRTRSRRRMLALVTTHVDGDLAGALGRLRGQGTAVSVVHVLPDADHAAAAGNGQTGNGLGPVLAASGVHYYPVAGRSTLRDALEAKSGDGLARAR